jgi:cytochrome P450
MRDLVLSSYTDVRDALLHADLQQALFEESDMFHGSDPDGTLEVLHGEAHRRRRRVEQEHFRRGLFQRYELAEFPYVIRRVIGQAGDTADLVALAKRITVNVSAVTTGIALDPGDGEAADELIGLLDAFVEGALIVHSRLDKDEVRAATRRALGRFGERYVWPAVAERRAGQAGREDLVATLATNQAELGMDDDLLVREIGFFMIAAFHTSSVALVHTVHELFSSPRAAEYVERARGDADFAQACVHETLRLHPSSPEYMRRATKDVSLRSGQRVERARRVRLDLRAANVDGELWGEDAREFVPGRPCPRGVPPWGISFGAGMHFCMGQELAGGLRGQPGGSGDQLFGNVAVMLRELLAAGCRPAPGSTPKLSERTVRKTWERYPVLLGSRS